MHAAGFEPNRLDRFALQATRLAGLGLIGVGLWSAYAQPAQHLLWGSVMTVTGIGLCALYLPMLRIAAFAFLFFAGLVILGGLSPFAGLDMSAATHEPPGLELWQVASVLAASALLVAFAFFIEHARRTKRKLRARS